jgi:hypothetical protein
MLGSTSGTNKNESLLGRILPPAFVTKALQPGHPHYKSTTLKDAKAIDKAVKHVSQKNTSDLV